MNSSSRRKSRRRQLKTSHQKNWLTGRHAVLEALEAATWPVAELYVDDSLDPETTAQLQQVTLKLGLEAIGVSRDRLTELSGSRHHQGLAARMGDFPYRQLDDLLAKDDSPAQHSFSLIVLCDRLQDSHNFGAILRCCDAMKVDAVVIGSEQQAAVSPQVARSSAGAVNHVPVVLVEDLAIGVQRLKEAGFQIAAATEKSEQPVWQTQVGSPTVLIVGNEAEGIAPALMELSDCHLTIPMLGQVSSLNAAVAAGILLYEIRRQQQSST